MHARPAFRLSSFARFGLVLTLVPILLYVPDARGQVPHLISHQGIMLSADGAPLNGMRAVTFSIHDAAEGGAILWTETHADVEFTAGVFHVGLGSIEPLTLPFDAPYFLGIFVGDGAPLVPRLPLTSSPYGFTARSVVGETNVFPSDGNVGIGTGAVADKVSVAAAPQAKLDIEGDVRIGVVPQATDATKVLVQEDGNQLVKYTPIEDLQGGFNLPFAGTVDVPQPAFAATNNGGAGLQGTSDMFTGVEGRTVDGTGVFGRAAGSGDGVAGESTDGAGVSGSSETDQGVRGTSDSGPGVRGVSESRAGILGTSTSGEGVEGGSLNNIGVVAVSTNGTGLNAFGNPAATLNGTVKILSHPGFVGDLDFDRVGPPAGAQVSRLFIEEMEEDAEEEKFLVWSADQFVRYKTLNESAFDGILNNTALVVKDGAGNETTRINPDGTSIHEGLETFRGGIALDGVGVGITFTDGTTQTSGFSLPFDGTVTASEPVLKLTNQDGVGISGNSLNGDGVFGQTSRGGTLADDPAAGVHGKDNSSSLGIGVLGESPRGFAVYGLSDDGVGVTAESQSGIGVFASGEPAAALHGTVEIRIDGVTGRPSRLLIEEVEEDSNEEKILVWSADQFVRYKTMDESGFDGVLNNTSLIITDAAGNETTRINPDGTSIHEGLETFRGGIAFEGIGVGLTFADGTTQTSGFSLPFDQTVTLNQAAFLLENTSGDAIVGLSQAGDGIGVLGASDASDAAGVSGSSANGSGVRGSSDAGTGVLAASVAGVGVDAFGEPAARLNGTVEIATDGDNGRPSRLSIQQLDEDPNEEKFLVWSADQFVRFRTLDESGFDGMLNNTALVIRDGFGNETTRIDPDGTSTHTGPANFRSFVSYEHATSWGDCEGDDACGKYDPDVGFDFDVDGDAFFDVEGPTDLSGPIAFGDCDADDACGTFDPGGGWLLAAGQPSRDALDVGVQITRFGGTTIGNAASFLRIGNTSGNGIGGTIGEFVFDPGIGGMWLLDRNDETFVQADASSKALFVENLVVTGTLDKPAGSFKIDHPLDPENKYLYHSFVESPDMMNVYNGNVVLDPDGEAVIDLPEWFEALNRDFRYQLTALGGPGPGLYVSEEIAGNRFRIAGGTPELKVSWQVTGVRQDPFAEQHRIQVEVEKPAGERGTYLHPEVYGLPASRTLLPMGADARQARRLR